ncbi:MAG: GIY-YIG nuclease family protein [Clostridia bacterium]|nr:GIY-YIG nuclease family protein [Clostridia bacterium]
MKNYYVYIMSNKNNSTIYIGVTNDIIRRVEEHKKGLVEGFTKRYNIKKLVYVETTSDVKAAIQREKQLKGWVREKKDKLISDFNPTWEEISLV